MDEELFEEEEDFFCSICGKKLHADHEIDEEICEICLNCIIECELK